MEWVIAVVAYLLIGEAICRYYTRKQKFAKKEDVAATQEFLLLFLWLPFLFLLAIIVLLKKTKTKTIKIKIRSQQKSHSATLKGFCQGPMGLCEAVKYDCSKCQSINQQNALEKMYGEKANK